MPIRVQLTNKRQPNKLKFHNRHHRQRHPQPRLRIQRQPKEPLIRRIHQLPPRLIRLRSTFEHPVRFSRGGVDFIPPAQADEAAAGDVFEVVEVEGEGEDGEDEDEDEVFGEEEA